MPAISLKDFGKEGGGIISPAVQWRFRILAKPNTTQPYWDDQEVTINAVSCDMDFSNDLIGFVVRQPIVGNMLKIAIMIAKEGLESLTLDSLMDGSSDKVSYTMVFRDLTTMEHYSKYDYASNDPVVHGFKFKYKTLEIEQKLVFKH